MKKEEKKKKKKRHIVSRLATYRKRCLQHLETSTGFEVAASFDTRQSLDHSANVV